MRYLHNPSHKSFNLEKHFVLNENIVCYFSDGWFGNRICQIGFI